MSKNKFDRTPAKDSIPEVSVPKFEETNTTKTETVVESAERKLVFPPKGRVYAEGFKKVRIREEPNTNAKIVAEVPVGEDVILGETANGWTKVNWSNLFEGWMMDKYIARYR